MRIVKLMGGLGNQMFEYAFGYALMCQTNEEVLYDLSWFDNVKLSKKEGTIRDYKLNCFNCNPKFASKEQIENCINKQKFQKNFFQKIFKKNTDFIDNITSERKTNVYEPQLFNIKGDAYYDGFFQCEKYFKEYRKDILNEFTLKEPLDENNIKMLEQIKSTNSISIHIRRGDYVEIKDIMGLCSVEYYQKAMDYIASNVQNPHFYLFSDDIPWVVENLKTDYPYTVIDFNKEKCYFDIELMKNCKHNITANSSFSWWGAWLNSNPDKIVISPKKWYNNPKFCYKDIIPEGWIRF